MTALGETVRIERHWSRVVEPSCPFARLREANGDRLLATFNFSAFATSTAFRFAALVAVHFALNIR
jgi:hypothetical protein